MEERRAEQVGVGRIVSVSEELRTRLEQRDDLAVLAHLEVTLGQHQIGIARLRVRRHDSPELGNCQLGSGRLVVGERQIQANRGVGGIGLERQRILRNRIVVLPEPDVGGAEVRQGVGAVGGYGEHSLVGVDCAKDVAGLMQLDRPGEEPLGVRRALPLSRRRSRHGQECGCEKDRKGERRCAGHWQCREGSPEVYRLIARTGGEPPGSRPRCFRADRTD